MAPAPDVLTDDARRRRWPTRVAAVAGVGCVVTGAALLVASVPGPAEFGPAQLGPPAVSRIPAPATPAPATPAPATPAPADLLAPDPTRDVHTPGTVPVELTLPDRAVTAPVVPVRTDPSGALVAPDPPWTVGWWAPGPLVGSATGRAVLAGHVDSASAGLGALAVLRETEAGEPVEVRGADGRVLRYRVTARRQYHKTELPAELFTADGAPGLVLITCGGRFDPVTGSYEDNVVVQATPVA